MNLPKSLKIFDVFGSSHVGRADEELVRKRNRFKDPSSFLAAESEARLNAETWFPPNTKVKAFPGLTLTDWEFPENSLTPNQIKSSYRRSQTELFYQSLRASTASIVLLVTGSNDYKTFITKQGKLVPLSLFAFLIWDSLRPHEKACFNPYKHPVMSRPNLKFIQFQIEAYLLNLSIQAYGSRAKFIIHSSILERVSQETRMLDLPIYFAIINYFLRKAIYKLNFHNSHLSRTQTQVVWRFCNVSYQFHSLSNPSVLFLPREQLQSNMVHRQTRYMREISRSYSREMLRCLHFQHLEESTPV